MQNVPVAIYIGLVYPLIKMLFSTAAIHAASSSL